MTKQPVNPDPVHPTGRGYPNDTGVRAPAVQTDEKGQTHENTRGAGQAHLSHPSVAAIVPAIPGGPAGGDQPNVLVSAKTPGEAPKVTPLDEHGHTVTKKTSSD